MMNFDALLQESSSVTNLVLKCQDGAVASHKLLVAGLSWLLRNLLADTPPGDEVTMVITIITSSYYHYYYYITGHPHHAGLCCRGSGDRPELDAVRGGEDEHVASIM